MNKMVLRKFLLLFYVIVTAFLNSKRIRFLSHIKIALFQQLTLLAILHVRVNNVTKDAKKYSLNYSLDFV